MSGHSTSESVAVVDVGKSGVRLAVRDAAGARGAEDTESVLPRNDENSGASLGARIVALLRAVNAPADLHTVAIGATIEFSEHETRTLATTIQDAFGRATVITGDDGTLAHARLVGGAGSLLSVGTGVIAISVNAAGEQRRFDGWGPLLGDRGGASDLGMRAVRLAHQHYEAGTDSAVLAASTSRFGAPSTRHARTITADSTWPTQLAHFGGDVATLAEQGVADAIALVRDVAASLAETAGLAAVHAAVPDITVTGRFGALPAVSAALGEALRQRSLTLVRREVPLHDVQMSLLLTGGYRSAVHLTGPR